MPVALGITFVPTLPPERLRSVALAADAAGLDELWVWEDCFAQSGVAQAAAALAWTGRIRVGIGLLPAPLRNVALTAMEIATLARMFPGRLVPAVGHGVQDWMGQTGTRAGSPMTLLDEYATALRRLLAGEEVTVSGRYVNLDRVRLTWPPAEPLLMVGGQGPKSLDLAARRGDGVLLVASLTHAEVTAACERVRSSSAGGSPLIVGSIIAATGPDAQGRVDREVTVWGREAGLGIGTGGDAAQIAAAVSRLAAVGATSVSIQPTGDEPDLEGFIAFLGSDVKPLLGD